MQYRTAVPRRNRSWHSYHKNIGTASYRCVIYLSLLRAAGRRTAIASGVISQRNIGLPANESLPLTELFSTSFVITILLAKRT